MPRWQTFMRVFTTHHTYPGVPGASLGGGKAQVVTGPTWHQVPESPGRKEVAAGSGRSLRVKLGLFFPQTALSAFFQETNIPYSHHHHQMVSVPYGLGAAMAGVSSLSCSGSWPWRGHQQV